MNTGVLALKYSNPKQSSTPPCSVQLSRQGDFLVAEFNVTCVEIYAKRELGPTNYPYEFDVVELFVTCSNAAKPPYYEYEVSPYNQSLQVNVIEPRQEYYFGIKGGFQHSASPTPNGWTAEMRIPLTNIGWRTGLDIKGNAYAALGQGERRTYWSLFELPAGKPDFHVPAAFRRFF